MRLALGYIDTQNRPFPTPQIGHLSMGEGPNFGPKCPIIVYTIHTVGATAPPPEQNAFFGTLITI